MPIEARWTTAVIAGITDVAADVREFTLMPDGGCASFTPGSHIDVEITTADGRHLRSYSLVGEPGPVLRIAVKRQSHGRGGSRAMWSLAVGDQIRATAPRSDFELTAGRPDYLLVAGGIGITAILGMAQALRRRGHAPRLVYAGRGRGVMPYLPELAALLGDAMTVFAADEGRRADLAAAISDLHPQGEMYVCGPARLLQGARVGWRLAGRPSHLLRFETFGSSGRADPEPFAVHVRDHGRHILVPRDRSLLEAMQAEGIDIAADCLRGECGLCMVDVSAGGDMIDHRCVFLSDDQRAAGDRMCACVSRATGPIEIDTGFRPALARVIVGGTVGGVHKVPGGA
jgi:ferredoxin-NADP reductase